MADLQAFPFLIALRQLGERTPYHPASGTVGDQIDPGGGGMMGEQFDQVGKIGCRSIGPTLSAIISNSINGTKL